MAMASPSQPPTMTGAPITNQPSTVMMSPVPLNIPPGTPPGLAYLLGVNSILIKQQMEWAEVLTGFEENNRYDIYDGWGRRIYFAAEDSGCCTLLIGGTCRPWTINIFDSIGQHVMIGQRESSCFGCGANSVQVKSPYGPVLGTILQNCEPCSASWDIMDGTGASILTLEGPTCSVLCPSCATCCAAEFPLRTKSGEQVGAIFKMMGDVATEMISDADNFNVNFPADLDVNVKATLIFATFMIDFMYYETTCDMGDGGGGHGHGHRGRHRGRRY